MACLINDVLQYICYICRSLFNPVRLANGADPRFIWQLWLLLLFMLWQNLILVSMATTTASSCLGFKVFVKGFLYFFLHLFGQETTGRGIWKHVHCHFRRKAAVWRDEIRVTICFKILSLMWPGREPLSVLAVHQQASLWGVLMQIFSGLPLILIYSPYTPP